MNATELLEVQQMVKEVLIADEMIDYAVDLVSATNGQLEEEEWSKFVQYGSGPRGLQSIIRLAKARALMMGRYHVSIADIKTVAKPALRHRVLMNYEGEAEGINVDHLLDRLIETSGQRVPSK